MKAAYLLAVLVLAAAPAVAEGPICADSSSRLPVAVDDGRIPFAQAAFGVTKPDTDEAYAYVSDLLEVPEGYRAVVEHVSFRAAVPSSGVVHTFQIGTPSYGYGNVSQAFVAPKYTGHDIGGQSVFIGSQITRIDLEAGESLRATALRSNEAVGDFRLEVTVAGYLVAVE